MSIVVSQILTNALLELNVVPPGQAPAQAQMDFCLNRLNQILDDWNADRAFIYSDAFPQYTLTANLNPHTIGPSGATWTQARPVSIEGIVIILSGSPAARVPVTKMNAQWWQNLQVPGFTSAIPTGFYYDPTLSNGSVYFYPVPSTAYDVQLWTRTVLSAVAQADTVTLAPGYQSALTLTLAEQIAGPMRKPWTASQQRQASEARARIRDNNIDIPNVTTQDAGMPRGGLMNRDNEYNWRTGNLVTP